MGLPLLIQIRLDVHLTGKIWQADGIESTK
jgi:hypothetical protein